MQMAAIRCSAPFALGLAGWGAGGGLGGEGEPGGAGALEGRDGVDVAEGQADVVVAFHEAPAGVVVDVEGRLEAGRFGQHEAVVQVDDDLGGRVGLDGVLQGGHRGLGQRDRQQAGLGRVRAEDITEPRRDHRAEPVVGQRPDRVLAGRAGAEVGARDQDRRAVVLRLVEHERRVLAPGGEQALAETGPAHPLEVLGRDDLVGVHVGAAQRHRAADVSGERFHRETLLDGALQGDGYLRWTMNGNSEPHRRVRRQGPATLRGDQIPATTTDQRLLDRRGPADWVHTDPWRVMRIQAEFVEGFGLLAELGPAVSIFGSARTARDSQEYETAERIASGLVTAGYAVITGGGPGVMEAANRGAVKAGGGSVGLGIELPAERGLNDYVEVGLEFRYFFVRKTVFIKYSQAFVVLPDRKSTSEL